jgi:hypothetical protein
MDPVDFGSDRGRMDGCGFEVSRECSDSGIERGAPLVVFGRRGIRACDVGFEYRNPRFALRNGAAQPVELTGQ